MLKDFENNKDFIDSRRHVKNGEQEKQEKYILKFNNKILLSQYSNRKTFLLF